MSRPTLEPLWHRATGEIGYKLGIEGTSKNLFLKRQELLALRALINGVLEDHREPVNI